MEFRQDRLLDGRKVLLAVHGKAIRELLTPIFKQMGASAILFGSGAEMLRQIKEFNPGIVFCEADLDTMDGIDFVRQVRKEMRLAMAIILLVEQHDGEIAAKAREAGASDVLLVPFSIADIIRTSKKVLEKPEAQTKLRFGPRT